MTSHRSLLAVAIALGVIEALLACTSYAEDFAAEPEAGEDASTPLPEAAPHDGPSPTERFCERAADAAYFYCSDFDLTSASAAENLFPSPSLPTGSAGDLGEISLVDIDGSAGGSPPRAASIAIPTGDGGLLTKAIAVDPSSDQAKCELDVLVRGAPGSEAFEIVHFYPLSLDLAPRGAVIELVPAGNDTFVIELRFDVGAGSVQVGTLTTNTFRHIELSFDGNGAVRASAQGGPAVALAASPHSGVNRVTFGVTRSEAASILLDNIRCTK